VEVVTWSSVLEAARRYGVEMPVIEQIVEEQIVEEQIVEEHGVRRARTSEIDRP